MKLHGCFRCVVHASASVRPATETESALFMQGDAYMYLKRVFGMRKMNVIIASLSESPKTC